MIQSTSVKNAGFRLYGFKAVQCSVGGGKPLVWFEIPNYNTNTPINWIVQYRAYVAQFRQLAEGVTVTPSDTHLIQLGQSLVVNQNGVGIVATDGAPGVISIVNEGNQQFTCGITQQVSGIDGAICAFPLFSGSLDAIVPIERVMLMFATRPVNTGTVIEQSLGPGLMINLTGSDSDHNRSVGYDMQDNWIPQPADASWATPIPVRSHIVAQLIDPTLASPVLRR